MIGKFLKKQMQLTREQEDKNQRKVVTVSTPDLILCLEILEWAYQESKDIEANLVLMATPVEETEGPVGRRVMEEIAGGGEGEEARGRLEMVVAWDNLTLLAREDLAQRGGKEEEEEEEEEEVAGWATQTKVEGGVEQGTSEGRAAPPGSLRVWQGGKGRGCRGAVAETKEDKQWRARVSEGWGLGGAREQRLAFKETSETVCLSMSLCPTTPHSA